MNKNISELFNDLSKEQIEKIEEIINQEKTNLDFLKTINLENELSNLKQEINKLKIELSSKANISKDKILYPIPTNSNASKEFIKRYKSIASNCRPKGQIHYG